jgi:MYXO-CTERM domain-containing protein
MSKLTAAAVGAIGLAGYGASQADASLIVDVRATNALGGAVLNNNKSVTFSAAGQTVILDVYARVNGTDGNNLNEAIQSVQGSIASGTGPVKGNITGSMTNGANTTEQRTASFRGNSSNNAPIRDIDGDLDLDAGQQGFSSDATQYFVARNNNPVKVDDPNSEDDFPPFLTSIDANTAEIRVGSFRFTYTGGGGTSLANFITRLAEDNTSPYFSSAVWVQDGVGLTPTTGSFTSGSAVSLIAADIPEPTGLALAGLGAIGLVARRRSRNA